MRNSYILTDRNVMEVTPMKPDILRDSAAASSSEQTCSATKVRLPQGRGKLEGLRAINENTLGKRQGFGAHVQKKGVRTCRESLEAWDKCRANFRNTGHNSHRGASPPHTYCVTRTLHPPTPSDSSKLTHTPQFRFLVPA